MTEVSMKTKPWMIVSVVIVGMLAAGNLIGYWFFGRSKAETTTVEAVRTEEPRPAQPAQPADNAVRALALDRRDKALEALRAEDYDKAIANFEAAQELDPTLTDIPKFIEVARKLKSAGAAPEEKAEPEALPVKHAVIAEPKQARVVRPREKPRAPVIEEKKEAPALGLLLVTTSPSKLLVEVDGKPRDLTPTKIELPAGPHSVRIIDGERTVWSREVDLDPGEVISLNETITAPPVEERPKLAVNEAGIDADRKLDLVRLIDREATPPASTKAQENKTQDNRLTPTPAGSPPRVLVFLPGKSKAALNMPGCDVRVLTRTSELKESVKSGPVDALLASPSVLQQYGLRAQLSGVASKETRFVAASFRAGQNKESLASGTIAAVDELGKKETSEMVARLFGTTRKLKLRRVTKLEDLVSTLQLNLADSIVVRDADLGELRKKTQQELHLIELAEKADPLAVGFVEGGRRSTVERALLALDASTLAELGVSRWSP
jgi:hypothetical protein